MIKIVNIQIEFDPELVSFGEIEDTLIYKCNCNDVELLEEYTKE